MTNFQTGRNSAFADDKLKMAQNNKTSRTGRNIVANGKNAGYHHCLLFP